MKIRISLRALLLGCGLSLIAISPPAIAACILFIISLKVTVSRASMRCVKVFLTPLLLIFILGSISVLITPKGYPPAYLYFKDGFYFLLPILALGAGIGMSGSDSRLIHLLQGVIVSCVVNTVILYSDYLLSIGTGSIFSLNSRYLYDLDSNAATLGFIILLVFRQSSGVVFTKWTDTLLLCLFVFSIAVSLSRVNILISVVVLVPALVDRLVRGGAVIFTAFCFCIFILFGGAMFDVVSNTDTSLNFSQKITNSISEIVVRDMYSPAEINQNWRGYEGFLGIEVFRSGGAANYAFGQGFGSHASAGSIFASKFLTIPIFHMGYVTVLLKSGWLGLILYFAFFYNVLVRTQENRTASHLGIQHIMIKLLCISLLLKTFFVMGIYTANSQILELVVLGAMLKSIGVSSQRFFSTNKSERGVNDKRLHSLRVKL